MLERGGRRDDELEPEPEEEDKEDEEEEEEEDVEDPEAPVSLLVPAEEASPPPVLTLVLAPAPPCDLVLSTAKRALFTSDCGKGPPTIAEREGGSEVLEALPLPVLLPAPAAPVPEVELRRFAKLATLASRCRFDGAFASESAAAAATAAAALAPVSVAARVPRTAARATAAEICE